MPFSRVYAIIWDTQVNELYNFIYRGILTEESLDKVGRQTLSFNMLDIDRVIEAERMSIVYTALHAFENSVRHFVSTAMAEEFQENWWEKVPVKVQNKVRSRIEEDAKFRWHGSRGGAEIEYCDFGDLSSIIITNWQVFEDVLVDREWAKSILSVLERSRNIVMHGGNLARQDLERIGNNIRDWIRQAG